MNQEVFRSTDKKQPKWSAIDPCSKHPLCPPEVEDVVADQEGTQDNKTLQLSEEYIFIKDSCDISVNTTDTKAALSLQAALQAAIAIVISIAVADDAQAEKITQELMQTSKVKQLTYQKTIIENSRNVDVTTTDTQVALNIQVLLQLLLALLVKIDVL
ncbi:spore coat protein [Bacillus alkalicellulosilyticus]|uniref:spore coat protein n=1 Tax=Alkalihalobacterium alkalicellulosilyticum TaxID=1912214 RepID=UPI000995FC85|nr:spore coat protein [Bacillus alkalicellulosilyticus]